MADRSYYSGAVEFSFGNSICRLAVSVIVYRSQRSQPEAENRPITALVPVWWEFRTFGEQGETLNDFSFSELVRYVL